MRYLHLIILIYSLSLNASQNWKWAGVEIIGNKTIARNEILKLTPIKISSSYLQNVNEWNKWCSTIKDKFDFVYTHCSAVIFSDSKAFLTVNIVEKGEEHRIKFRQSPKEDIELADINTRKTFKLLQERMWQLFKLGNPPKEDALNGYLMYDDKKMAHYVKNLLKLVPNHRKNLIEVIEKDKNEIKRGEAATLLNWAQNNVLNISKIYSLLDDPSSLVRNNISRFMLHYFSQVRNKDLKHKIIKALALQLERPTHGDRNKAIFCLLEIAKSDEKTLPYIKKYSLPEIKYLSKSSILYNVQDPAIELLKLINNL